MSFEIRVDEGLCMRAMRCTYLAPEMFEINAEGVSYVKDPAALPEDKAIAVAEQCPNVAIVVVRDGETIVG
jgi:ferredoxin